MRATSDRVSLGRDETARSGDQTLANHDLGGTTRMTRFTLPLRGLAGEGAQAVVDRALGALAGVRSAHAGADQLLHIEYDAASVTPADIHEALRRAGIVHVTDAERGAQASAPTEEARTDLPETGIGSGG